MACSEHRERPAPDTFWETDIKLPNINCDKCTVQVLQFMEEHGLNKEGEFSYHHCADLKITADPALPIDKSWPGPEVGRQMPSFSGLTRASGCVTVS
jgi:hypothetical protein